MNGRNFGIHASVLSVHVADRSNPVPALFSAADPAAPSGADEPRVSARQVLARFLQKLGVDVYADTTEIIAATPDGVDTINSLVFAKGNGGVRKGLVRIGFTNGEIYSRMN